MNDDIMEMLDKHIEKIAKERDFWKNMYFERLQLDMDFYNEKYKLVKDK